MRTILGRIAALATALALHSLAADAATLSIVSGAPDVLDADFDPSDSGGAAIGDPITAFTGRHGHYWGGLWINGKATLIYTYIGYEAGAQNIFHETTGGGLTFVNNTTPAGSTMRVKVGGAGYVPFKFQTSGLLDPVDPGFLNNGRVGAKSAFAPLGLAFSEISRNGRSVLAFFDDGRIVDTDYDDMIVRIDVAPVPLPAGGVLLASALIGAAALRRRRA